MELDEIDRALVRALSEDMNATAGALGVNWACRNRRAGAASSVYATVACSGDGASIWTFRRWGSE